MDGHMNATAYQLRHPELWETMIDGEPEVQVLLPVPSATVTVLPDPASRVTSPPHERRRRTGR